jgi:transcriptional regulator with PAS, ATPase and Fis domain
MGAVDPVERLMHACAVHMIGGVKVHPILAKVTLGNAEMHWEAYWDHCYEADQHLLFLGPSAEGVCWASIGYATGFSTGILGYEVFYKELECRASGAARCKVIGLDVGQWGPTAEVLKAEYGDGLSELRAEIEEIFQQGKYRFRNSYGNQGSTATSSDISELMRPEELARFIVKSDAMADLIMLATRVAPLDTTVLIMGESGTGKEFMAQFLHERSNREGEPFIVVNCAAIPENLLESELFGHVKGAFTGAIRDKIGLFEQAGKGTLVLDEVGELQPSTQAKLLRALDNHEIRPVGGNQTVHVRARVIASTNRNLRQAAAAGTFREDLYYRLGAFVLTVPPLRERPEEIEPLAQHFLRCMASRHGRPIQTLGPDAVKRLLAYDWPGNVRELQHAVERAAILANEEVIKARHLPQEILGTDNEAPSACLDVKIQQRRLVEAALHRFNGNRTEAAKALQISTVTLWRRMRQYALE